MKPVVYHFKDSLISVFIWALFSLAFIRVISIFMFSFKGYYGVVLWSIYVLSLILFILYYRIKKSKFIGFKLYLIYAVSIIVFTNILFYIYHITIHFKPFPVAFLKLNFLTVSAIFPAAIFYGIILLVIRKLKHEN